MGRKLTKGPRIKSQKPASKKLALQRTGRKRLGPTKAQRRKQHALLEKAVGYKIPKLSDVVYKPSNYRVKRRSTQYNVTESRLRSKTVYVSQHTAWTSMNRPRIVSAKEVVRMVEVPVRKVAIGERLIVSKNSKNKGGPGRKTGGSADRSVSHKTGSLASKRYKAKAAKKGTKGMKSRKEKKKKKK